MRGATALGTVLAVAVPAFAGNVEPVVRNCSTSAYGDLGRGWQNRSVLVGPVAFVGMRSGYRDVRPSSTGHGWPLKVLVVVEPKTVATVTIGARSRRSASLGYDTRPLPGTPGRPVPLTAGSTSVRFEGCARANPGPAWNRGTQFPGYFLVSGRRCVGIEVRVAGRTTALRRTLRFGAPYCGS
jgi:hypothetical protein